MKRDVWPALRYFLQLLLSLAAPPVGLSLVAVWARSQFGWGLWVPILALVLGAGISLATCVSLLRAFLRMEQGKKDTRRSN